MKKVALLGIAVWASASAAGPLEERLAECARNAEAGPRLECFDALARDVTSNSSGLPAPQELPVPTAEDMSARYLASASRDAQGRIIRIAEWNVRRTSDAMTDRPRTVFAMNGLSNLGRTDREPTFVVRCDERGLDVFVLPGAYLGASRDVPVRFRVDQRPPVSQVWNASSSGDGAFARDPRGLITQLRDGTRLLLEAEAFDGQIYRSSFDLKGIEELHAEMAGCPVPGRPNQRRR